MAEFRREEWKCQTILWIFASWWSTGHRLELFGVFSGPDTHYVYPNGDEVSNIDLVFLCRDYSGTLTAQPGEVEDLRFFAPDDLPAPLSPPVERIIRKWAAHKQAFRPSGAGSER